jgi:hypothetical protein
MPSIENPKRISLSPSNATNPKSPELVSDVDSLTHPAGGLSHFTSNRTFKRLKDIELANKANFLKHKNNSRNTNGFDYGKQKTNNQAGIGNGVGKIFKSIILNRTPPKRLDSQMSTGTASTYLSSMISTDSSVSPNATNISDFNFYEDQRALLASTSSYVSNSATPSRSNSDSSSASVANFNHKISDHSKNNRESNTTNTNSGNLK